MTFNTTQSYCIEMKRTESFTFRFIQIAIVFGVLLYDFIGLSLGFTYIDEILLVVLIVYACAVARFTKELKVFLCIFALYFLYSALFGVACYEAILTDAIIYLKPFVGFYAAVVLGMNLNQKHKQMIKRLVVLIAVAMMAACAASYSYVMSDLMGHPARFATLFQVLGVTYLYCSNRNKKDIFITMLIWSCSIMSLRSKSYAFVAAACFVFYYLNAKRLEKISFSTIFSSLLVITLVFIVAWEKFQFYFIQGSNADLTESFARPALYQGALLILKDFLPFGPGFGSYACYASSVYYSPLYYKYGLSYVYGLGEDQGWFISDTFFPQLAQFGVVGIVLFAMFFYRRYKETISLYKVNRDSTLMKMSILIIIFFMIESSVDSTFVHNRGMVMMVLWGMIVNELKIESKNSLSKFC